jgi:hypothetical protein
VTAVTTTEAQGGAAVEAKCATTVEQRPPSFTLRHNRRRRRSSLDGGPPLVATQRWRAWIWARRWPPSSTATTTVGVSAGPRSGPDGPRSELGCFFFIFKIPFFVSVGNDRYYKLFIFCIVQIISVAGADTKYRFPTDTINTFCCSDSLQLLEALLNFFLPLLSSTR